MTYASQVSLESLLVIVLILAFFLLAVAVSVNIRFDSDSIQSSALNEAECRRLAAMIEEVFVQGKGTQAGLTMASASQVLTRQVKVNNSFCPFSARVSLASLNAGPVLVQNVSGTVLLSNG